MVYLIVLILLLGAAVVLLFYIYKKLKYIAYTIDRIWEKINDAFKVRRLP
jgi:hypothetical protein